MPSAPIKHGTIISHYRILDPVGAGGMGMVYRAMDLELDRVVALKFISGGAAWLASEGSGSAEQRFVTEAKTASALDHPNIGTIHAIDRTPDGQLFIVMGYYEGETLQQKLARGPLARADVDRLFTQVASGIAKAHEAGIVHRDIKPANVIVNKDHTAKVIDFGLARFRDAVRVTQTGGSVGTPGYMAPEQVEGGSSDARADVWALGCLLFEMATGRPAFDGQTHAAIITAVLTKHPEQSLTGPAAGASPWKAVLTRALHKEPERRYADAGEMLTAFTATRGASAGATTGGLRPWMIAASLLAVAVAGYGWKRASDRGRMRAEDIPAMARLLSEEKFVEARRILDRVEPVLGSDSAVQALREQIMATFRVQATPSGTFFAFQEYSDTSDTWTAVVPGRGDSITIPRGAKRWRMAASGHDTLFAVTTRLGADVVAVLTETSVVPPGMVMIPQARASAWIAGLDPIEGMPLDTFFIDRYEVSNKEYKAFVDAGGYTDRALWKFPFTGSSRTLAFDAAMRLLVDATGKPGPATWELGTYPRGQDDFPVAGVSWYEAAAYAEWAQKSLPTVYHWVLSASTQIPEFIVSQSNFSGTGTAPRGRYKGMSRWGVLDVAGNVREWQFNTSGAGRHAIGGAWNDPTYAFTFAGVRDPLDRSSENGFRCVVYKGGRVPADAGRDLPLSHRDYSKETPVSDAAFRLIRNQFSYDPAPLDAKVESTADSAGWRHEVVSFAAAYGNERVLAHLYYPTDRQGPFQTVVHYPGSGSINARTFSGPAAMLRVSGGSEPYLVRSGYAFVVPIVHGTFERNAGLVSTWPRETHQYTDQLTKQIKDVRRTVDYLATRPEFDLGKLAYYGLSWGGRVGVLNLAVEPRFKLAILADAGLAAGRALPEVDVINFATRIRVPVLMLNGKFDAIEPYESAQLPLYRLLQLPAGEKKHVVWDAAHATYPANEARREVLAWLERFFGPTRR
jgi:eukaryotic-like serine/threonine-protein kinase